MAEIGSSKFMMRDEETRRTAWECHQAGRLTEAEQLYRKLLQTKPQPEDATNLGSLLRSQGRLREAIQGYTDWLKQFPEYAPLSLNAINCAIEANQIKDADHWISQALIHHPNDTRILQAQARTLQADNKHSDAIALLRQLTNINTEDELVWLDLGYAYHLIHDREQALTAFQKAAELAPNDAKAVANTITLFQELGRYDEANSTILGLPNAVRNNTMVRGAVAYLFMAQQQMGEALKEFRDLCTLEALVPQHWLNACACLRAVKRNMEALKVVKQGLVLNPKHTELQQALIQCLAETGRINQAKLAINEELSKEKQFEQRHLFNLQFLGSGYALIDPSILCVMAKDWEDKVMLEGVGQMWGDRIREPIEQRKLRVGYLSSDFCNHPVGRFILPILEKHNQQEIEVIGLNTGKIQDDIHREIRSCCHEWIDIQFNTDLEAARIISDLKLDILVELGGYTAGSRIGILCHRPAPLQWSYLGYFAPTYLDCIDGWIGDKTLFGGLSKLDRDSHKLILIKGGYMGYKDRDLPLPDRSGRKGFTFGCFNHARKISHEAAELFAEVVIECSNASLLLKSISFTEEAEIERVRGIFNHLGLDNSRLTLLPWIEGRENHLKCYNEIDVALDPFPYGGATTTCEALAMGVPVVSLAGSGMVSRLSASVLKYSGCKQWIAHSKQDYKKICSGLAAEGARSKQDRLILRKHILSSDLCNCQRLATRLEKHYREAVDAICTKA
uniref:O-linked N-acetylglucosamine transferase, SPINDLY family protein n=1 Tax=Cyanobium sp. TaxID=2164130 RepID=UPI00404893D3